MGDLLTPGERVEASYRGFAALPDPPCRPDGGCAVCGQPRAKANRTALYANAAASDPFCSTACARAWHGCELAGAERTRGRPGGVAVHGTESCYVNGRCRCDACKAASAAARRA